MSIAPAAAAKRGKKFKDVSAVPAPQSLPEIVQVLLGEFPWLPQSIDLTNKGAAGEFVKRRLYELKIDLGAGLFAFGRENELCVVNRGGTGETVARWPYGEVAAAIVAAGTSAPPGHSIPRAPAEPTPAARQLPKPTGRGVMLSLKGLERHPINRQPAQTDIEKRAASLKEDGQLEDIVVRQLPGSRYQIISGETRCLAAGGLGWKEIRCTVIECDDAEAMRLVGLFNAERSELNPIQKAQHIEAMCAAGMSREEAARSVGLESGGAASNLVRLLKLPKLWQDRVASGELAETWARQMLPLLPIDAALKAADQEFKSPPKWGQSGFDSRTALEDFVEQLLNRHTRRLDNTKRRYGGDYQRELGSWEAMGEYPCLLHADEIEANRKKLAIVTIAIDGKNVEVATNVKLFDELQCAAIKKQHEAKAKKKAVAAGKKADGGKDKPKSAAELREAAELRTRQLTRSIDDWRERVMRNSLAAAIAATAAPKTPDPRLLKLLLHFLCEAGAAHGTDPLDKLKELVGFKDPRVGLNGDAYEVIQGCGAGEYGRFHKITAELCAFLIAGDADGPWEIELVPETLQALFEEWGCDLTAAWRKLFASRDPILQEFFEMHRKEELRELAKECVPDLYLADSLGKPQMISLILGRTVPPALPKCLQPEKKRETKPAGKRGRS